MHRRGVRRPRVLSLSLSHTRIEVSSGTAAPEIEDIALARGVAINSIESRCISKIKARNTARRVFNSFNSACSILATLKARLHSFVRNYTQMSKTSNAIVKNESCKFALKFAHVSFWYSRSSQSLPINYAAWTRTTLRWKLEPLLYSARGDSRTMNCPWCREETLKRVVW